MSAQIIELLIFAGIAFFVINKLIATLGSTSDDDPAKRKPSFFGESGIRDVTYTTKSATTNFFKNTLLKDTAASTFVNSIELTDLIVEEYSDTIIAGIKDLTAKLPSFKARNFLNSAKSAFEIIIEDANDDDIDELIKLVDKKYIQEFHIFSESYGEFVEGSELYARISQAYTLANNVFIKVLFTGERITSNIANLHEEWTFSRNLLTKNINWLLINVERL